MPQQPIERRQRQPGGWIDARFAARVLFVLGIGMLFLLVVVLFAFAAQVLVLLFAAILLATLLNDAAAALERLWPGGLGRARACSLGAALLLAALVLGGSGWMLAPRVLDQAHQLADGLPEALQRVREHLAAHPQFGQIERHLPSPQTMLSNAAGLLLRAGSVFSGVVGVLSNALIVLFVAIYLAASPATYVEGALKLLPPAWRPRGRAVGEEIARTLTSWLRGKLLSMFIIGSATAAALALIGVPLALTLGVLAGLLDFIPYIGPVLAAVPALLIAFAQEPQLAWMTAGLVVLLQSLEGYLVLPLVERRTVALAPALTIMMQVLMGWTFGLAGVAIATPLAAVLTVLVAMLYVQDVLGDAVTLPSQQGRKLP